MAIRPQEELITNRTLSDVNNNRTKGNWNIEDLNRIGTWQIYIRDKLKENGYFVNITPKTDFIKSDLTNMTTKINKIKTDTKALKDAYYTMQDYNLKIGHPSVDYIVANNIEKILNDIDVLSDNMIQSFIYCGTIYAGE